MPVRRKPSGRWEVRVAIGGGRRIERTLPVGATRKDALAVEAEINRRQTAAAAGRQPDKSLDDAIRDWVETHAKGLKSWDKDLRYRVANLAQFTAGKRLADVPAVGDDIRRSGLVAGLSPAAINRYLAILRRVAHLAVQAGWIDAPIHERVQSVPGERQRDALLSPAQVLLIIQACPDQEAADAIRFASLTGLRRGEQMRLRADQIADGMIWLDSTTKAGKHRVVPLTPEAAEIAARRIPWRLGYQMANIHFKRAARAVGLPNARWHDLRHAYGSWLAAAGVPLTDIRDLMGHSSVAVTSRYLHSSAPRLKEAAAKLPSLRGCDGAEERKCG